MHPLHRRRHGSATRLLVSKVWRVIALLAMALTETTATGSTAAHGKSGVIAPAQVREPVPTGSSLVATYDNNTTLTILDVKTVESSIVASQLSGPIVKVSVSIYLTHTYDSDLTISLISPDGIAANLTARNGGNGDNYGRGCTPLTSRTMFADSASTAITSATPPFAGTFRPQQTLSVFNGKTGAAANGAWRLRINDAYSGDSGTLFCWSLNIETLSVLIVNTTTDAADLSPGDGVCATPGGQCTLRAAVQELNATGGGTIMLPAGIFSLTVAGRDETGGATGDINIASAITIQGQSGGTTFIDAAGVDRAFQSAGGSLILNDVTVRNGDSGNRPGGCFNFGAGSQLTLARSGVIGCNAGTGAGGGVRVAGTAAAPSTLTMIDSTIAQGTTLDAGGALSLSGNVTSTINRSTISGSSAASAAGIDVVNNPDASGVLVLVNSTISGNVATAAAGALRVTSQGAGKTTLTNATIASNSSGTSGSVVLDGPAQFQTKNSIIANGAGAASANCFLSGGATITSLGNNVEFPGTGCGFTAASDRRADPLLAPLGATGGASVTHALGAGSPAIDLGDPTTCSTSPVSSVDQRGFARPAACDAGSTEAGAGGAAPIITLQPQNRVIGVGQTTQFTVAATAAAPIPVWRWQVSSDGGATFTGVSDGGSYAGSATPTLTVSEAPVTLDGLRYRVVAVNALGTATSASATLGVTAVSVALERTLLSFSAVRSGSGFSVTTPTQQVRLATLGSGLVTWTASSDQPWLKVTPASGTGSALLSVSIAFDGSLPTTGSVSGSITIALAGTLSSVGPISANLQIMSSSAPPFGSFDTPAEGGSALEGSVAVTGWTLDDIAVRRVELWRDLLAGETTPPYAAAPSDPRNGRVFIAYATFVDAARPDVERLSPSVPFNSRAGWGYLMLTWGLYNQGNGTYKLYAFGVDQENNTSIIGTKTIVVNNNAAAKPFGSIDTPAIGGDASGVNFGWALTPKVNGVATCKIQSNGVKVSIDSGPLQPVGYGDARTDIAGYFTGFSNTSAAGGHFSFDWTTLTTGAHTIGWLVTDDCNRAEGVGSRFFNVPNGTALIASEVAAVAPAMAIQSRGRRGESDEPVAVAHGFGELASIVRPDETGVRRTRVVQGDRIEVRLPRGYAHAYQMANGHERPLPIGSSWDQGARTFSWQPAPGFLGSYDLIFESDVERIKVRVVVEPPS